MNKDLKKEDIEIPLDEWVEECFMCDNLYPQRLMCECPVCRLAFCIQCIKHHILLHRIDESD